jgi:hypothetical protein
MDSRLKRLILEIRAEKLRAHLEHVARTPGFERALSEAESELRSIEQRKDQR